MKKNRDFSLVLIITLGALLVGGIAYYAGKNSSQTASKNSLNYLPVEQNQNSAISTNNNSINSPQQISKVVDWNNLMPSIETLLKQEYQQKYPDTIFETHQPMSIGQKIDITGDDIPEALVNLGTGGATTDVIALVQIQNNKPIIPLFKQKDGKISTLLFAGGGGGGGRYGSTTEMLPAENAVYYADYWKYGDKEDHCIVSAYKWNSQTKIFDYNLNLSNQIQQDYCRTAGTGIL